MDIPFLDRWRKRPATDAGGVWTDPEGVGELLAECELLRVRAASEGLSLSDDGPEDLAALDQLLPRWRDDPDELDWLGNDAGLYLGTVIVRTVPGAHWGPGPEGPVVVMASGREVDVVTAGRQWADTGAPELSQIYAEVSES
ncbi:DUF6278 family protein [Streptomyces sp. 4N509B]|uniref:DUF6278 family protein n=1 Tax=Streptomyces sp. 4N509B TaxID=3457413 RepID=UPI003FCF2A87